MITIGSVPRDLAAERFDFRGRLARSADGFQLAVVYCRPEALAVPGHSLDQLLQGMR